MMLILRQISSFFSLSLPSPHAAILHLLLISCEINMVERQMETTEWGKKLTELAPSKLFLSRNVGTSGTNWYNKSSLNKIMMMI